MLYIFQYLSPDIEEGSIFPEYDFDKNNEVVGDIFNVQTNLFAPFVKVNSFSLMDGINRPILEDCEYQRSIPLKEDNMPLDKFPILINNSINSESGISLLAFLGLSLLNSIIIFITLFLNSSLFI